MRISIIIPCYNQAEFLPDAIESALNQTISCEIIVINDGSTDNSLDIARGYESQGVKVINQVNKGLPSARNTGIMNTTGDYILPLDADDMLMETCAEKMLKAAESGADVISTSFKCFGVSNDEVILKDIPTLQEFKDGNRIGYFSAIKKSVLLETGGYSPRMVWGYEDWHLWFDIFKRGKILAILSEVLVLYRTKENSMIHNAQKHHNELFGQIKQDNPETFLKTATPLMLMQLKCKECDAPLMPGEKIYQLAPDTYLCPKDAETGKYEIPV